MTLASKFVKSAAGKVVLGGVVAAVADKGLDYGMRGAAHVGRWIHGRLVAPSTSGAPANDAPANGAPANVGARTRLVPDQDAIEQGAQAAAKGALSAFLPGLSAAFSVADQVAPKGGKGCKCGGTCGACSAAAAGVGASLFPFPNPLNDDSQIENLEKKAADEKRAREALAKEAAAERKRAAAKLEKLEKQLEKKLAAALKRGDARAKQLEAKLRTVSKLRMNAPSFSASEAKKVQEKDYRDTLIETLIQRALPPAAPAAPVAPAAPAAPAAPQYPWAMPFPPPSPYAAPFGPSPYTAPYGAPYGAPSPYAPPFNPSPYGAPSPFVYPDPNTQSSSMDFADQAAMEAAMFTEGTDEDDEDDEDRSDGLDDDDDTDGLDDDDDTDGLDDDDGTGCASCGV